MPSANQRVSEYILVEMVGGGTFGEVWKAHHHVWADQLVAIKIPTDPQYVKNLQHEGAAIHGLTHPNIVRAMGFDPYADPPYLVMEFVPGTSLRPLIKDRKLTIEQSVSVLKHILNALTHAHGNNIVHRDIKPENILIHEDAAKLGFEAPTTVKVTDFGLGRAATTTAGSIAYSASLNDAAGREIAGTLDYMAPEQRSGADVDATVDLYACGVILYEMLTGERPAGTELPSDLNPKVPKWLDDVFRRSYARRDKRFNSAKDFIAALSAPKPPPIPGFVPDPPRVGPTPPRIPQTPPVPPSGPRTCPQCRQNVSPDDNFCMACGVQLVSRVRKCPRCGAYPDTQDQFCMLCGEQLKAGASV